MANTAGTRDDTMGPAGFAFRSAAIQLRGSADCIRIPFGHEAGWANEVDQLTERLAGLPGPSHRRPVVALTALPFDRNAPAEAIVPRWMEVHKDGESWVQQVDVPSRTVSARKSGATSSVLISTEVTRDQWCNQVSRIVDEINSTHLQKAVLFRTLVATADQPFEPNAIFDRLTQAISTGYAYLVDGFVGVSPELLVRRSGSVVRSQPMAGTLPLTGDHAVDANAAAVLRSDPKLRAEHQITIDRLHAALLDWCSYLDSEPEPSVVKAASVQHLATLVEGELSRPLPSVLDLVAALHPTPAVGGWPVELALWAISEIETCERGHAGGPVGWFDATGDGEFAVGIRCAEIGGTTARLYAGVGVVEGSDPQLEFAETQAKFQTVLPNLLQL